MYTVHSQLYFRANVNIVYCQYCYLKLPIKYRFDFYIFVHRGDIREIRGTRRTEFWTIVKLQKGRKARLRLEVAEEVCSRFLTHATLRGGRRRVSAHNPVRWQLIIPHLPILTLSYLASAPSQPQHPFSPARAPSTRASSSFSSYTPNRAFSIPPSFTSIRIRLALSVRRVITLINKMEVGMREFCPLFLSPSIADVSHCRCRRRRRRHRHCLHVFSSFGHESIA